MTRTEHLKEASRLVLLDPTTYPGAVFQSIAHALIASQLPKGTPADLWSGNQPRDPGRPTRTGT